MSNKVTIYSNGVADYRRTVKATSAGNEVQIPVRQVDLDDVLGSLGVFGEVSYSPPIFSPENSQDGTLELSAHDVYGQFAEKLRNAKVVVEVNDGPTLTGQIVGLNTEPDVNDGDSIDRRSLVVSSEDAFKTVQLKDIASIKFDDEQIQSEINKAMQRAYQKIKPESTFVTLNVKSKTDADVEATVQYITSAAAWKLAYRLREITGQFQFEGFAVVDNNTEEDWNDANISVVVGEPVSFKTDLAQVRSVQRNRVNIVQSVAQGAVEVEEAMALANMSNLAANYSARGGRLRAKSMARSATPMAAMAAMSASDDMCEESALEIAGGAAPSAPVPQADVQEIGDYCVFTSSTLVTIPSKQSALVPVFQHALDESKTDLVLYYKPNQRADRAFRSIRFSNELEHSLGRGACSIYNDGAFVGQCVIPSTKTGQKQLLPHALETGVLIRRTQKPQEKHASSVLIEDGVAYMETSVVQSTMYQLKSNKDEKFTVVVDHDKMISGAKRTGSIQVLSPENAENPQPVAVADAENLERGIRYTIELQGNQEVIFTVTEDKVDKQEFAFADNLNLTWFMSNVAVHGGEFKDSEAIASCIEAQKAIDANNHAIGTAQTEARRLAGKQDRLRKNLAATESGEQVKTWQTELATAETRLTKIEEEILPSLEEKQEELNASLREALRGIAGSWKKN